MLQSLNNSNNDLSSKEQLLIDVYRQLSTLEKVVANTYIFEERDRDLVQLFSDHTRLKIFIEMFDRYQVRND